MQQMGAREVVRKYTSLRSHQVIQRDREVEANNHAIQVAQAQGMR